MQSQRRMGEQGVVDETFCCKVGFHLSSVPHPYRVPTLSVLREGKMFHCDFGKRWNGSAESKNLCQPKEGVPPKAQRGKAMLSVAKTQCVESSNPVFAARVLLQ